jgi:acylphosphatase
VIARRALVTGRVQGVFLRAFVQEAAQRHGVAGWAANLPDGSVEVHAEGSEEGVDAVLAAARSGPSGAAVDRMVVREVAPEGCADFSRR